MFVMRHCSCQCKAHFQMPQNELDACRTSSSYPTFVDSIAFSRLIESSIC